jgi:diamine N-acetyltransferase
MITVRRAEVEDALLISVIAKQTFTETFGELFSQAELDNYLISTFNLEKIESSIRKPSNTFGLLNYYDKSVGYYKLKLESNFELPPNPKEAQLQKIYVLKEYWGKKLGEVLLEHIFQLNEIQNIDKMWLAVLHTNVRAIKFYENNGFVKLKKYYHTIGQHHLKYELMIKSIP